MKTALFWGMLVSIGAVFAVIGEFIAPIQKFLIFAVVSVVVDTVTGIVAATRRGEKIQSKKFGRVVIKISQYLIAIAIAHYTADTFLNGNEWPTYAVAALIAAKEVISIFENIGNTTGIDFSPILDKIIPKIKEQANEDSNDE